jgi:PHD/YefM family antitoxin component YafN of YafNO toxin-antitoxin module
MKSMVASEVRRAWARTLGRVEHGGQIVLVTRNGREAAILMPCGALDLLHALEAAVDKRAARQALTRRRGSRRQSWSAVKRRYGLV